jgi:hypothetical protein
MPIHDVSMGAHLRQHEQDANGPSLPTDLAPDQARQQTTFSIQDRQQVLDVPQPGLDLDD